MPAQTQELRKHLRVNIKNGAVRLMHPVMPPLTCGMLDLSEGGARCCMRTAELDNFASTAWRQLLGSGKLITVEIPADGSAQRCNIYADVRHVKLGHEGEITFGLKFHRPDAMQQDIIGRTIRGHLRNKERRAFEEVPPPPEPSEPPRPTSTVIMGKPPSTRTELSKPVSARQDAQAGTSTKRVKPSSLLGQAKSLWNDLITPKAKTAVNYRGMKIGEILMRTGRITPQHAVTAYEQSRAKGVKFGRYLVSEKLVTSVELCRALSLQTGLPVVDLSNISLPDTVKNLFSVEFMKKHEFAPFNQFGPEVYIAVALPLSKSVMADIQQLCSSNLKVFLAREDVLLAMLNSDYFQKSK